MPGKRPVSGNVRGRRGQALKQWLQDTETGQTVDVEPIDLMTFNDAGLITSMRAFWSEADLRVT